MVLTLPSNILIVEENEKVKVNGIPVDADINEIAFMYSFDLPVGGTQFEVQIDGLRNPEEGPYEYSQLQIVIQDKRDYPID